MNPYLVTEVINRLLSRKRKEGYKEIRKRIKRKTIWQEEEEKEESGTKSGGTEKRKRKGKKRVEGERKCKER